MVLRSLEWGALTYFAATNLFYIVLLVSATWEMRHRLFRTQGGLQDRVLSSEIAPWVTVLAPAYNEAVTIGQSVRAFLGLYYPRLEVVVVNDGSVDATMDVLRREFDLLPIHPIYRRQVPTKPVRALYRSRSHPNLVVVEKDNGGKADALNAGLNNATGTLVCAVDADTLIEADALQRMVRVFIAADDVVAAGGTIRPANAARVVHGRVTDAWVPRHPLAGFQAVEYLRAFLFGRLGWNRLGGNLVISGAFGLFRRDAMLAAGGYAQDTVGEDMELVLRLRTWGYETGGPHRVEFIPDPVAWTEVPETLQTLGRQRDRWQRGLADVLWRYRRTFCNPRYGAMGLVAVPYFVVVELAAPVVEAVGLAGLAAALALGALDLSFALLFFLVAYALGQALTVVTIALDEFSFHRYDRARDQLLLAVWATLESFGYRQLNVLWRLRGLARFLAGKRDWGGMERRGFHVALGPSDRAGVP